MPIWNDISATNARVAGSYILDVSDMCLTASKRHRLKKSVEATADTSSNNKLEATFTITDPGTVTVVDGIYPIYMYGSFAMLNV